MYLNDRDERVVEKEAVPKQSARHLLWDSPFLQ
jgi:hypothetical protein